MKSFATSFIALLAFLGAATSVCAQQSADKILELFSILNIAYVDSFDRETLTEAAIISILAELDPHSAYIPSDEVKQMNESLDGEYEGIGIQFDFFRDTVIVVSAVPGGPSDKMGVMSGDKIIKSDGKNISGAGLGDEDIVALLRGKKGSTVLVSIKRRGVKELIEINIVRDKIPIYSVDASYMLNESCGYIKINRFSRNTVDEFKTGIKDLKEQGMRNLVLDLRDNGGGYLHTAVALTDEFIDGKKTVVETKGLRQTDQIYRSTSGGIFTVGKLIILINEGSASASEIVAGAVQDLDRGIIIGRRSFGKGLVMKPYLLSDGSVIRLTTSRYYTPSGRCIQKDYGSSKYEYENELKERFDHGEMFTVDSLTIKKDEVYLTSGGRRVYGGGGILPDVFVPADTILAKEEFQLLFRSQAFVEYSTEYTEQHRPMLSNAFKNPEVLIEDHSLDGELMAGFNNFLKKSGTTEEDLDSSFEIHCLNQIKAFVARHLWDDRAYYMVLNSNLNLLNRAMELFSDEEVNWQQMSILSK